MRVLRHPGIGAGTAARSWCGIVWAATAVVAMTAAAARAEPLELTVVHFNDLDRMEADEGRGGLAKVATLVKRARAEADRVLVTHGGDAISPSLFSGIDRGAHMIALLNRLGLDAMVAGNHEFDFGPDTASRRADEAAFPVLTANARGPDGSPPASMRATKRITMGDWTIGLLGLTTPTTAESSSPGPVRFRDPVEAASERAAALRAEGADVVFALAHTEAGVDDAIRHKGDVDLVLGGHDHELRVEWEGEAGFVEAFEQGKVVALIHLVLERGDKGETQWRADYELRDTRDVEPDPAMAQAVAAHRKRLDERLGETVGRTRRRLDTRRRSVRRRENAFGNLVADAVRSAVDADTALINGGSIRGGKQYEAGARLTRRDLRRELPFGNRVVALELRGEALREALENGLSRIEEGAGRFPHVSGMEVAFDPSRPAGRRVVEVRVNGAPLQPDRRYTLATNAYLAGGGDDYEALAAARRVVEARDSVHVVTAVMNLIEQRETIAPRRDGRLERVQSGAGATAQ